MTKPLLALLSAAASLSGAAQSTHNDLPLLHATGPTADYRLDRSWSKGNWGFDPRLSPDVLSLPVTSKSARFAFYTGKDSIVFLLKPGAAHRFYVRTTDNHYALTEVRGYAFEALSFGKTSSTAYPFLYEQNSRNAFLDSLRRDYNLPALVAGLRSDSARALRILKWTHDRWSHNGDNEPSKNDALTILAEARGGKQFRCVEYGIVAASALNAIGLPARVLGLKTKDVETTPYGAGHVLLEVYLRDLKKWVLLDGQWDAMPLLNGVPLNAVEFQQAIARNYKNLQIRSRSGCDKDAYVRWIYPYLYYFDVRFDNREGLKEARAKVEGKQSLMLVPEGAKEPTIFQKTGSINYALYTRSMADFYAPPR